MKKHLLTLALLLFLLTETKAQQYHPFPTSDGAWLYGLTDDFHQWTYSFTAYVLQGDTTIGGGQYKKISNGSYAGAMRESNKIIYFVPADSSHEYVLYNFNLTVGDTIINPFGGSVDNKDTITVVQVDSVLTQNGYYRQLRLSSTAVWIEGIGSLDYLLQPAINYNVSAEYVLACFSNDSNNVYSFNYNCTVGINEVKNTDQSFSVYPNPANSKLTIHAASFNADEVVTVSVMNILEQNMLSFPPLLGRGAGGEAFDVSGLAAGMYFLEMKSQSRVAVKRFVKE